MAGSLDGVRIKLDRAKSHMADLHAADELIDAAYRDVIVYEADSEPGHHSFKLATCPPISRYAPAIIGDAIHNARSALDHLAGQLVLATTAESPNSETYFPIREVAPTADRNGKTKPQISPKVPPEVVDAFDQVQPYKAVKPAHHNLAVLHALDIADKHRALLVSIVGIKDVAWWGDYEVHRFGFGPYEPGDEICCLISETDSEAKPNPHFAFAIRLDEPAAGPWGASFGAFRLIARLIGHIESEVLPAFEQFF